ncbi:pyridoxamine 5'-phosphate oxidase family protein [Nocardia sp. CDC153]|uniref:pyridoxamine 5'-phosphate oxidase family protein n=1 Tax=Nocardia sp. CDC153 TaxID=3112167 RepID=UPI002DBEA051|nr:pyridoxamine 5'-phosphate oxidase family protein [Nocardia sp. CDC153]MEC3953183.1 pyridoxamine 5'-phosphate oxidase family protein [Nocardia sp. CDC153]
MDPFDSHEEPRSMVNLSRAESLRLLATVPFGRVVFTRDALPAIRPVNHIVDGDQVIVRTRLSSRLTTTVRADPEVVVAFEADDLDPVRRLGWSVVVTGIARTITDPMRVARYDRRVRPWIDGFMDTIVAIEPTLVTGVRLVRRGSIHAEAAFGPDSAAS